MKEILKDDEFIQYIVSTYLPTNEMTYQEKIQIVFSSMEDFARAMECFKLNGGVISKH